MIIFGAILLLNTLERSGGVVAASATVGMLGREGATLRKTILPTIYYLTVIGVLGLIAIYVLRISGPLWAG